MKPLFRDGWLDWKVGAIAFVLVILGCIVFAGSCVTLALKCGISTVAGVEHIVCDEGEK